MAAARSSLQVAERKGGTQLPGDGIFPAAPKGRSQWPCPHFMDYCHPVYVICYYRRCPWAYPALHQDLARPLRTLPPASPSSWPSWPLPAGGGGTSLQQPLCSLSSVPQCCPHFTLGGSGRRVVRGRVRGSKGRKRSSQSSGVAGPEDSGSSHSAGWGWQGWGREGTSWLQPD